MSGLHAWTQAADDAARLAVVPEPDPPPPIERPDAAALEALRGGGAGGEDLSLIHI